MMNFKFKNKNGFSTIELIFYIALFSVFSLVIINAMLIMIRAFRSTSINTNLARSSIVMERISREIRLASNIDTISATDLVLSGTDAVNTPRTVEFVLNGNNVEMLENTVSSGNLNAPNVIISNLIFTQITTTAGTAVKVSYTANSTLYGILKSENFYDTVVLRGDY